MTTRLWILKFGGREFTKEGYLQPVRYRFENKSYYIGTKHGYDLILYAQVNLSAVKQIERIDVRTFDHDIQVMKSRLFLEDCEKVSEWRSDRQLKSDYFEYFQGRGSRDSAPDGAYLSLGGKTIAFEYEIAQKSKKRYQDKVYRYVSCIRQTGNYVGPRYDHVRIVCEKEAVFKILTNLIKEQYLCFSVLKEFNLF